MYIYASIPCKRVSPFAWKYESVYGTKYSYQIEIYLDMYSVEEVYVSLRVLLCASINGDVCSCVLERACYGNEESMTPFSRRKME